MDIAPHPSSPEPAAWGLVAEPMAPTGNGGRTPSGVRAWLEGVRAWPDWLEPPRHGDDERVVAVARRPGAAARCALQSWIALPPPRFRFALAADAAPDAALRRAEEALSRAAAEERPFVADVPAWAPTLAAAVEDALRLHHLLVADWTERQAEVVRLWRLLGRQADVAERLGITQSSVSQTLARAHAQELAAHESSLAALLDGLEAPGKPPAT